MLEAVNVEVVGNRPTRDQQLGRRTMTGEGSDKGEGRRERNDRGSDRGEWWGSGWQGGDREGTREREYWLVDSGLRLLHLQQYTLH